MTWTCLKKRSRVEIYAIMFDIVKYISFKNKIKKSKQLQNIWHSEMDHIPVIPISKSLFQK